MRRNTGSALAALGIAAFLLLFLAVPVLQVVRVAFSDGRGGFTLVNFQDFFRTALFAESFWNSLYVALMSMLLATAISVPLAYFTTRLELGGAILIQSLGVIPLIIPPFVGAVAMQLVFGRSGSVNLLLESWLGVTVPFMEGLNGVIFVETLHYFPFLLMNLSASLANIDSSMEESAQNLGASGLRLFRRIVFPLAMPGYVAGALLVFTKVFDELGTPLLLNVTKMMGPQAYLRITTIGVEDPMGYVLSVIMVAFSLLAMGLAGLALRGKEYATVQKGAGGLAKRALRPWEKAGCYAVVALLLALVLSPHLGILLLSFGRVWSFSVLPEGATLAHYAEVFRETPQFMTNTLLYSTLAAGIDVAVGTAIAYLILRTRLPGRHLLDYVAMSSLAIPGVVLGIGYLRTFHGLTLPWTGQPLATFWPVLVVALSVRRLPYALRACVAALQQVHPSFEEAAENLGAHKLRTVARITVPLMSGGILAGFVASFVTAAVELSTTLMLVSTDANAPLSYGIYVYMQSAAGRGPGAALGIVAVALMAAGAYFSNRFIGQGKLGVGAAGGAAA
ncbi:MAG: ABC transporter permease [Candidatus Tectomicrobia bacterium RIFCSPLOWO2_12_FULL_69_37]|nr:MAG: ABC transporter permease [Candidatus Tectomicrobia bacterium RIFCSPLOWO2_12_FULL_69_37]OGL61219.1 MAG: ABC transporter permease [Candidatus Tectomicrobia bacterium RIFCSPLOWO2_02_FULL_70_19]